MRFDEREIFGPAPGAGRGGGDQGTSGGERLITKGGVQCSYVTRCTKGNIVLSFLLMA